MQSTSSRTHKMAFTHRFTSLTELSFRFHWHRLLSPQIVQTFISKHSLRIISTNQNLAFVLRKRKPKFKILKSVELDQYLRSDDEEEMGEGFFEAIEELERMVREPSDILGDMNGRLSARELRLVLVYFSQQGRDSWCALEVFEWLKKENKVDNETMEVMVSITCSWAKKLIENEADVGDVVDLLLEMDCVGFKPGFSMIDKVISMYWEMEKKEEAVLFVENVLRKGIEYEDDEGEKGGPTAYLAWKMMVDGNYMDAVNLVINLKESGLKPEISSYLIAMTAIVKELNDFAKALRKLKGLAKSGLIAELDDENVELIEKYQANLVAQGLRLSKWAIKEGSSSVHGSVHERLLAMYICAGRGLEAETQLWEMKVVGKEVGGELYDIVLAICASQKESSSISRLLTRMEVWSSENRRKSLSWLLRGYVKGGHVVSAAETMVKMLEMGLCPEYLDGVAVLQELRKRIQHPPNLETYINLCRRLYDASLIGPCLVYLYIKKYKLWVINMV